MEIGNSVFMSYVKKQNKLLKSRRIVKLTQYFFNHQNILTENSPFGEFKGTEGFTQFVGMTRNAFPDIHMTIDDMIGEGEKLAVRLAWTGTFKGKFGDMEPTGKQVNMTAAYFYRFESGKEVEATPYTDMLSLYQQMGIPIPSQ